MIELIFAIVIIGIISISIPTIMINNARSVEQNLLQEGILIVATKTGQALTYPWDENSDPSGGGFLAKTEALNINEVIFEAELDRNISDYRRGHFQQALRRKLTPISFERSATDDTLLGLDAGDAGIMDDVDDFNGVSVVISHVNEDGYKNDYNVSAVVFYVDDNNTYDATVGGANTLIFPFSRADVGRATNIKMVELNVRREVDPGALPQVWKTDPDIVFRTFVSNLGETDYYKRIY